MTWDFQQCGMCDQQSLRPACAYAQSDRRLCLSPEYSMSVWLPTERHLEFTSLKRECTGSSESTLVKMPHCWKSHVMAQFSCNIFISNAHVASFHIRKTSFYGTYVGKPQCRPRPDTGPGSLMFAYRMFY